MQRWQSPTTSKLSPPLAPVFLPQIIKLKRKHIGITPEILRDKWWAMRTMLGAAAGHFRACIFRRHRLLPVSVGDDDHTQPAQMVDAGGLCSCHNDELGEILAGLQLLAV